MIQTNPETENKPSGPVCVPVLVVASAHLPVPYHYKESPEQAAQRAAALEKQMAPTGQAFDPKRDLPAHQVWLFKHRESEAEQQEREDLASGIARVFGCMAGN